MMIKIVALGFVVGDRTYLRSAWNVIDAVIVVAFLVEVFTSGSKSAR